MLQGSNRYASLCYVNTGATHHLPQAPASGKPMRCVWWVMDGTQGFASPRFDSCRSISNDNTEAKSGNLMCMHGKAIFACLASNIAQRSCLLSRVAMAMRVASRRVADQLRCNPTILNGSRLFQNSGPDAQQGAPKPVPMSKLKDSFLDGTSSTYLEDMEERYRQDPSSVDKSWASFFRSLGTRTHAAMRSLYCRA